MFRSDANFGGENSRASAVLFGGSPDGERRLLARLRAGDEAAYAALVREHGPRMLVVARRILGNDTDAEDAVQEAFL
ncbi:MAG: hypothetical protein HYR85_22120, partial [Planctomycetes bacterium]|nr:hypothetical protein [Planctomycetota bacterium]